MATKFTRKRWRRPQRLNVEGLQVVRRKDLVVADRLPLDKGEAWRDNRKRMAAMLLLFFGLAALEGLLIGWVFGAVLIAVPVALGLGFGYLVAGARFGDRWIQGVLRAQSGADPTATVMLVGVSQKAGVPVPELLVGPGHVPNALSLGLRRRWIVLTGGVSSLGRLELEALLAHEVAHLRDGDAALASAYVLLAAAPELGTKAVGQPAGPLALLALPLWPVCLGIRALRPVFFRTDREHRADVAGSLLTVYPPGMVKALTAAAPEQQPARLRTTDPFWFAPRGGDRGPDVATRAARVAEM